MAEKRTRVNLHQRLNKKSRLGFVLPSACSRGQHNRNLHTLYNTPSSNNFTPDDFAEEVLLYEEAKHSSGLDKFTYRDLPSEHPLLKILEAKRERYLLEWDSKLRPIGTSHKSDEQIICDFKALRTSNISSLLDEEGNPHIIRSSNNLFTGLNQYFPEMAETRTLCYTVIDALQNKDRFHKIYIKKFLLKGLGWNSRNFFKAFNKCFKTGSWTQMVGNFQPLVMKYIILESFNHQLQQKGRLPGDKFVILDPCTGWGGRLLGTLCSFNDLRSIYKKRTGCKLTVCYISTDPNRRVHDRFLNIIADWFDFIETKGTRDYFKFDKDICGSETDDFLIFSKACLSNLGVTGVNLAMTSPPYFDREQYSSDPSQSFIKYPTYARWHDGFLKCMIRNTYELLLDGGHFYLNIADIKAKKLKTPIASDALKLSFACDFNHLKTYKMLMGNSRKEGDNTVRVNNKVFKYEPIFVLEK
ncbi:MAG: hypothetical protein WCO44_17530 [Bacteroidota bacterium]